MARGKGGGGGLVEEWVRGDLGGYGYIKFVFIDRL